MNAVKQQKFERATEQSGLARQRVAVVGIGCRLPGGVVDPDSMVEFLRQHGDGVVDIPRERWDTELHYHPDPSHPGKSYARRAAFLHQDVRTFDPAPFEISPREASHLDPQQRLLLEVAWEALEDAGIPVDQLRGSNTAVLVGGFTLDYQTLAYAEANRSLLSAHTSVGASMTLLSNRLSYTFDLRGPSLTVDTACSSSLVAVHYGCRAIAQGEADLALVGGVNVMLSPATMAAMCKGRFLAADGRSKTFDAAADGYGRGEGAAIVVLKPLARALSDGDRIYAVVESSGVNQDGRTDGVPMPNGEAQTALAERVLQQSGLRASDIGYVEAHGTGTRIGDRTEMRSLGEVYGRERDTPLWVGSVKTNLGHLEAAAGVTGFIKAALSVHRRELFPIRELDTPNPDIPFEELGLRVAVEGAPWSGDAPARAAVNAFGYGGTNAHVILGEAPAHDTQPSRDRTDLDEHALRLVPVSAADGRALRAQAASLANRLRSEEWLDQAYTLSKHRAHLADRAVFLARGCEELREQLRDFAEQKSAPQVIAGRTGGPRKLLWVFTGMGPQWWGMGQELYAQEPVFRQAAQAVDCSYRAVAGWSILEEMQRPEAQSQMARNAIAQPANFLLQVALVSLLRSRGVPEDGLLGHSVGELAAAWAAGCLSLEQAALVAFHRSQLQQRAAGRGTMLAAAISEAEAVALMEETLDVSIAAFNAPRSIALAGAKDELLGIATQLEGRGVFNRMMPVEVAYHSPHMDPLREEFLTNLACLRPSAPQRALYSTAAGARVGSATHDATYWWINARQPVLLQKALEAAIADGYTAFLEVGPQPVLGTAIREVLASKGAEGVTAHCLKRNQPESTTFYSGVAQLHCAGVGLDWSRLHPRGKLRNLPRYSFQRAYHWIESDRAKLSRTGPDEPSSLLTTVDSGATTRFLLDPSRPSLNYLTDHRIDDAVVFPGAGYIDIALAAARSMQANAQTLCLENLDLARALVLPSGTPTSLMLEVNAEGGMARFYAAQEGEAWTQHAQVRMLPPSSYAQPAGLDLPALTREAWEAVDVPAAYRRLAELGLSYGPQFQRLREVNVRFDGKDALTLLARLDGDDLLGPAHAVHPALLDSAFQALLAALPELAQPVVPVLAKRIVCSRSALLPAWVYAKARTCRSSDIVADVTLLDERGSAVLEVRGLTCRALDRERPSRGCDPRWFHEERWEPHPWPVGAPSRLQPWVLVGNHDDFFAPLADALRYFGIEARPVSDPRGCAFDRPAIVVFSAAPDPHDPVGEAALRSLRDLVQRLRGSACSLRIVTLGAHAVDACDSVQPAQSALCGLGRVIMTEHPDLDCRLIDLAYGTPVRPAELVDLMAAEEAEEEVAVRGLMLCARRLARAEGLGASTQDRWVDASAYQGAFEVLAQPTVQESTSAVAVELPAAIGEGDVEVYVQALAGCSVAGTVSRVGAAVDDLHVGQPVHALREGPPRSHVVLPRARICPLVEGHTVEDGLGYGDLLLALHVVQRASDLQPGHVVMVHGAQHGAGLACARLLADAGARVIGTIEGEPQAVRPAWLDRLYDNRTLDFLDVIEREFGSQSLQLIVNTGTEVLCEKSVSLIAPWGTLVNLSPARRAPDLSGMAPGATYCLFGVSALLALAPEQYSALVGALLDGLKRAAVTPQQPLLRAAEGPAEQHSDYGHDEPGNSAFYLHRPGLRVDIGSLERSLFRTDRSYVVTGGLGGFGLATAEWLARNGAGTVVLASRRGKADARAQAVVERMRRLGTHVVSRRLDAADEESVAELVEFVRRSLPPMGGIFHSAMLLDDQPIDSMDDDALAKVLAPKARGAWLLYEATRDLPLDYFVTYSSISAWVGNPNQGAYAAANAFLDGLSALARGEGRRMTAVSWGALGDVGVVADDAATQAHLKGLGIESLPSGRALDALSTALRADRERVGIVDMNWKTWAQSLPQTRWNRLSELIVAASAEEDSTPLQRLRNALTELPEDEREDKIRESVRAAVSQVLRIGAQSMDTGTSLREYGLDSLMAVELQSAIVQSVGVSMPTIQLLAGVSVDEIARRAAEGLDLKADSLAQPEPTITSATHGEDLRASLLSRICVEPPYFDLFSFKRQGDWVEACVLPVAPGDGEADLVSCAEAARHLAIVGSCAVSLRSPEPGKVYYPVARARYRNTHATQGSAARRGQAPELARVRARCVSFRGAESAATAEAEILDPSGEILASMLVDYHVIPQAHFLRLFAEHAQPTLEATGQDPYKVMPTLPLYREKGDVLEANLGVIEPAMCLGHFARFPAWPVSIMTRYSVQLVVQAVREQLQDPRACVSVVMGTANTSGFVFAGESASLTARRVATDGHSLQTWLCEIQGSRGHAASFELSVYVSRAEDYGMQATRKAS